MFRASYHNSPDCSLPWGNQLRNSGCQNLAPFWGHGDRIAQNQPTQARFETHTVTNLAERFARQLSEEVSDGSNHLGCSPESPQKEGTHSLTGSFFPGKSPQASTHEATPSRVCLVWGTHFGRHFETHPKDPCFPLAAGLSGDELSRCQCEPLSFAVRFGPFDFKRGVVAGCQVFSSSEKWWDLQSVQPSRVAFGVKQNGSTTEGCNSLSGIAACNRVTLFDRRGLVAQATKPVFFSNSQPVPEDHSLFPVK